MRVCQLQHVPGEARELGIDLEADARGEKSEALDQALDNSLLLEWACNVYWHAAALRTPNVLDEEQQTAVVSAAVERGYGTKREVKA